MLDSQVQVLSYLDRPSSREQASAMQENLRPGSTRAVLSQPLQGMVFQSTSYHAFIVRVSLLRYATRALRSIEFDVIEIIICTMQ